MSVLKYLVMLPAWAALLWGSLNIHQLDLHLGHSICGPWGCGPPTEALIGYHAFWCVLLTPLFLLGFWFATPKTLAKLGIGCLALGLIGFAVYVAADTYRYWQSTPSSRYLVQRTLFTLATKIDVPIMQACTLGSLWMIFGSTQSEKRIEESD